MDIDSELDAIDKPTLTGPVRQALQRNAAEVCDWQYEQLGGGFGNPVSLGLYRFAGTARDREETVPWSLVLKVAQSPANVGAVNMGEGQDPTHWNYWKRELFAYRSDLLDDLPAGLAAPRCFGSEQRPGRVFWLWLEEVTDDYDRAWSLEQYAQAARHFGRLSGRYLAGSPLPDYPWLSTGLVRQWSTMGLSEMAADFQQASAPWTHPLVQRVYAGPGSNALLKLLAGHERVVTILDRQPQTLCHHDAYPTNLMARRDQNGQKETVALDWAMVGTGPVGQELAQLILGALDHLADEAPGQIDRAIFEGYLEGLHESGWRGTIRQVRFGYAASAALRTGMLTLWILSSAYRDSRSGEAPDGTRDGLEATIEGMANATRFAMARAQEAQALLDAGIS